MKKYQLRFKIDELEKQISDLEGKLCAKDARINRLVKEVQEAGQQVLDVGKANVALQQLLDGKGWMERNKTEQPPVATGSKYFTNQKAKAAIRWHIENLKNSIELIFDKNEPNHSNS